jgi:uncharacterized integral membrane protein
MAHHGVAQRASRAMGPTWRTLLASILWVLLLIFLYSLQNDDEISLGPFDVRKFPQTQKYTK